MILSMLKSLGRSIFTFFARPAPTSVALMVGQQPGMAANDDQSQMLRRAMQAATAAEEARASHEPEGVQIFEPLAVDEADDSAAAQAAVFAPAKPMPAAPANDAQTHDAVEEPPFAQAAAPIEMADWVVVEIDELSAAEAETLALSPVEISAEAPVLDAPVEALANDVEGLPAVDEQAVDELIADEPVADEPVAVAVAVDDDVVEPAREDVVEAVAEEAVSEEPFAAAVEAAPAEASDGAAEKKPRKKRAPAKRKAAAKPRKAKAACADEAPAEPVPEDDVWVSDAVAWSLSGEWADGAQLPPESSDCPRRLEELREAAAEGRLTIWGRSGDAGTWQPIEASYWKFGTVEPASLTQGREYVVAEPKTKGKAKAARKYSALKVSRAQVEELWQPGAMH